MSLTIKELTQIPYLRTRIIAGASGAGRAISWAHSSEVARPWEWLEKGDLLMTVGLGIPADPCEQVTYVESLAAVQVSGIAIGENMHAPPLSDAMLETAERLGLPLLFTAFEVPFVQISKTVAGASQGPEHLRMVKTIRIYDSMRAAAVRSSSPDELLQVLGDEIACDLSVCTNVGSRQVFPGSCVPPPEVGEAFAQEVARRGGESLPGILRVRVDARTVLVVPVPARRAVSLIAVPRGSDAPPYAILQHVATVAALELERLTAAREERRRLGSEVLAGLLDARISPHTAAARMSAHGLGDEPMAVIIASPVGDAGRTVHHELSEREVPHMVLQRGEQLYCLTNSAQPTVEAVTTVVGSEDNHVGVSDGFTDLSLFASAVREARWAHDVAVNEQRRTCRYGEQFGVVGPRSIAEAKMMIERVLGPVIEYDGERGTDLVHSLTVFLKRNRSWQEAADELFVHKQTLVYRMRRVEELTGRKLGDTGTLAELWFAISALDVTA